MHAIVSISVAGLAGMVDPACRAARSRAGHDQTERANLGAEDVENDVQHHSRRLVESYDPPGPGHRCLQVANQLARAHHRAATTALVVGPCDTSLWKSIDWIASCSAVEVDGLSFDSAQAGARADRVTLEGARQVDLVFCVDVLDWLPQPVQLLRQLLRLGSVVVAVPYNWPDGFGTERLHNPIDEVKLQRWARRRWAQSAVVEEFGRLWLVAVFPGGARARETVYRDFGQSDDERAWLARLTAEIDAVPVPRRCAPLAEKARVRLYAGDPLREEITGSFGVYAVRALCKVLGFDEHRKFRWRLEHKLVQATVFNHYLGREFPASWGVDALVRRGLGDPLLDALLSSRVFAKEALGHLSGDFGEADATHDVLDRLIRHPELAPVATPTEETWLVQERVPIDWEYRVHSLEDYVLPGMTFDRYGPFPVPEARDEVNAYVASILARLPDALVGQSLYAWDIAREADGGFRVIEVNLVGFHPVYERGFQASGFFQYHPHGPPLLDELARHIEATYNVALDLDGDWSNEPNRHALFLRVFRHYRARHSVAVEPVADPASAKRAPRRLDGVLGLRAEQIERFALLRDSIACTGAPFGTLWITVPDSDLITVLASRVADGPGCQVVPESELVPELAELTDVPPGVRRQVARLSLVARVEGDFCFDLSPDVVCVRGFATADLFRGGKAFYARSMLPELADWYEQAEAMLGQKRSGWYHGTMPYLLSKRGVAELTQYLANRSLAVAGEHSSWRRFLLGHRGWALAQLYFTFLEALGLEERDYFPGEWELYNNCVWSADEWNDWDPAASFDEYAAFYFTVIQVGSEIPADAVRRRLAPYLGLPVTATSSEGTAIHATD
jgi:hypothetical protein